jgi:hypothetical protein
MTAMGDEDDDAVARSARLAFIGPMERLPPPKRSVETGV